MATILVKDNALQQALKSMSALAQPSLLKLKANKKNQTLVLTGQGEAASARMEIPVENPDKADLDSTVDIGLLMSAIDKRKDVQLWDDSKQLYVKAKAYSVELATMAGDDFIVIPEEVKTGETGITLKTGFMNLLLRVLPTMELRPLLSTYSAVPVGIKATKKGTTVAVYDFIQSALTEIPEATGKFEVVFPSVSQFLHVAKTMAGQKYTVALDDTSMYVWNDDIQVSMALPQAAGEQIPLEEVLSLKSSIDGMDYDTVKMPVDVVQQFLANSRAVYDKDSTFAVTASGEKAVLAMAATVGSTKVTVKLSKPVKKDVEFKCDLNFFSSVVGKAKGKTMSLKVNENLLRLDVSDITYLISLV